MNNGGLGGVVTRTTTVERLARSSLHHCVRATSDLRGTLDFPVMALTKHKSRVMGPALLRLAPN